MRAAFLLIGLALAACWAPLAGADHVFSHRTYVVGRVVDADGLPVADAPVSVAFDHLVPSGACYDQRSSRTGPQGDFQLCYHTHAWNATNATVRVAGAEATVAVDPVLRKVSLLLQAPAPAAAHDLTGVRVFNRTFHVEGRVGTHEAQVVREEGVPVFGLPVAGRNVTVRLVADGRDLAEANATTDEMGDYAVDLDVAQLPPGARVRVEMGAYAGGAEASATHRRADVDVMVDRRLPDLASPGAPGSQAGRVPAPGVALVAASLVAAAVISRGAWREGRR